MYALYSGSEKSVPENIPHVLLQIHIVPRSPSPVIYIKLLSIYLYGFALVRCRDNIETEKVCNRKPIKVL